MQINIFIKLQFFFRFIFCNIKDIVAPSPIVTHLIFIPMIYVCFPSILLDTTHKHTCTTYTLIHSINTTSKNETNAPNKRNFQVPPNQNQLDGWILLFIVFFFGRRTYTVREKGAHNFVLFSNNNIVIFSIFRTHN